ncbi:MAG: hypothetical protein QMD77_04460 [Patescibacteria group bacterium]|nr:hypothetical protein [Patescibacteria group bacterium]
MEDLKGFTRICVLNFSAMEASKQGDVCFRVKSRHIIPSENLPEGVLPVGDTWYVQFYHTYLLVKNEADSSRIKSYCQRNFEEIVEVPSDEFLNLYRR